MAVTVIRGNTRPAWLSGLAAVPAAASGLVQRAIAGAAAMILTCAVGAALLQLAAEILSFPAPIAVPAMTLMAAVLLNSLRRHLRSGRVPSGDHRRVGIAS